MAAYRVSSSSCLLLTAKCGLASRYADQGGSCAASSEPLQAAMVVLFNTLPPALAAAEVNAICDLHKREIDDKASA